jgi:hypothetical protein
MGAGFAEGKGDGFADSAGRARYYGYFLVKQFHAENVKDAI